MGCGTKALPHHRWATPSELRGLLDDRGFEVDLRPVQRDLKELQNSFPLDHPDGHFKIPHLWPVKLPQAGQPNYGSTAALSAMREAAYLRR